MIYPQKNTFRQSRDLSGQWDFKPDPDDRGLKSGWAGGFGRGRKIIVPASWNDQFKDTHDFLGPAWYQTRFDLPFIHEGKKLYLRFGSVNYLAEVWLNGKKLGSHEGGHLPFVFEITRHIRRGGNLLVVRVDGRLAPDHVPPGNVPVDLQDAFGNTFDPPASFDFFPYCGIQRPVILFTTPRNSIMDLTVITDIKGRQGTVAVKIATDLVGSATARVSLKGFNGELKTQVTFKSGKAEANLVVPNAKFWAPGKPNLYQLKAELVRNGRVVDQVSLSVGIRTVRVKGSQLLINGKPIRLKGFGRHEDHPKLGRYLPKAAMIKDYRLMKWVGADSFRTSHYPYSDEMMDLADRLGFLVIDETPAVGLFFKAEGLKKRLALCRQYTREMIERDKNHPSVIMWSLANEPHSRRPAAWGFFKNLFSLARSLDKTRPVTLASYLGEKEKAINLCDVICLNRYYGWYSEPGRLDQAIPKLSRELDRLSRRFKKPIILTEFGADALPGCHTSPPEMYSEEYQAELITRYIQLLEKKPYVAGAHVWNFSDFRTARAAHRPLGMNFKGVFTRERKPKLAAYRLRKLWRK
jgi:beta-glucuronidase